MQSFAAKHAFLENLKDPFDFFLKKYHDVGSRKGYWKFNGSIKLDFFVEKVFSSTKSGVIS